MQKGLFITFEGIDGAGKSTQINFLKEHLEKNGKTVIITREPGGTAIGTKIRNILLDKENSQMCSLTELLLYYADRAQHINEKILPALENGTCVICDRYFDSSYAYQLAGRGLDLSVLDILNDLVVSNNAMPDITFLLDLTTQTSEERMAHRGEESDRLESEGISFKERVRQGFLHQAELFPDRIRIINAQQSPESIFIDILSELTRLESKKS